VWSNSKLSTITSFVILKSFFVFLDYSIKSRFNKVEIDEFLAGVP